MPSRGSEGGVGRSRSGETQRGNVLGMDWISLFHQAFERGERSLELAPDARPLLYPSGRPLADAAPCARDDLEGLLRFMTYPQNQETRDVGNAALDLGTDEFWVGSVMFRDADREIARMIIWAIREQDDVPDPLDQLGC